MRNTFAQGVDRGVDSRALTSSIGGAAGLEGASELQSANHVSTTTRGEERHISQI
jgi:hypothetical protein